MDKLKEKLLRDNIPMFKGTNKHRFEVQMANDFDTRDVTIVLWCVACRSRTSLKIDRDDLILDEHAVRRTIFEMCEAHEHAWSTEENHDYTD